jgi:ferric-dicitrate binding protein FerR (iron transport regulator)
MDDETLLRSFLGRVTESEKEQIAEWRSSSLDAARRYRELERLLSVVAEEDALLSTARIPNAEELLRRRGKLDSASMRGRALWWSLTGVGAAAAAVIAIVALRQQADVRSSSAANPAEFVTGKSETSTLELGDGTVVRLAPASRLKVSRPDHPREAELRGHAYFAVAKAKGGAPFTILTTAGKVVVLGTQFDIRADDKDLRVVVVEGRVTLSAGTQTTQVVAGQVGQVIGGAVVPAVSVHEVKRMVAWVGNFLAFQTTPLREVASELERRYRIRVSIPDSIIAQRTVTTWLDDQTLDEAIALICIIADTKCSVSDGTLTIQARDQRSLPTGVRR